MKSYSLLIVAALFFFNSCKEKKEEVTETPNQKELKELAMGPYVLNEIASLENLQVFAITGEDEIKKEYTTLDKALKEKKVEVKETSNVNELSIDNNSDEAIFIHSGDIVKGGKQDRTVANDVIIPPRTKNVPLTSFCVEQGRWKPRQGERSDKFEGNSKMLSSKKLKLAAKYSNNQQKVWSEVSKEQHKLSSKLSKRTGNSVDVTQNKSATSLQLALESDELKKEKKELHTSVLKGLNEKENVIGYAYAINGEVYGVDMYTNKKLFNDLSAKITESIVTEAIAESNDSIPTKVRIEDVKKFIEQSKLAEGSHETKKINEATELKIRETKDGHLTFSSIDIDQKKWVHKNYIKKEKEENNKSTVLSTQRRR
ncbi:ARPP-1 family domain-containing protein [Spongiivirga citrea]|uniref:ARG and Rhodanese-Phosphatase-superfamily-associated domain-containing protein n=1 Tax=Spongiivirga citrea TaxID=1481457 RepID=A0A6M0CLT4_9FLAO|nr:DUF6569 family protein [Spongiivirga citrea]NER16387.1 hypothetical protein [Spongiivirga citrea]